MTNLQLFAYVVIPATLAAFSYAAVAYYERKNKAQGQELNDEEHLRRSSFKGAPAAGSNFHHRGTALATTALAFTVKFALGAFVISIINRNIIQLFPDSWSGFVTVCGGLITAAIVTLLTNRPASPNEVA
jgi:hypothetical protein